MKTIIFFLLSLLNLPILGQNRLYVEHITTNEGLSQNHVYAIVQDDKGFLWLGTQDGLNRYDGYQFTIFRHNAYDAKTISGSKIQAMCKDNEGNIWIGTGNGLSRINTATFEIEVFQHDDKNSKSLSYNNIHALHSDRFGQLWVGTGEGLDLFNPKNKSFTHFKSDSSDIYALKFIESIITIDDDIWIGTNTGLNKLNPKTGKCQKLILLPNKKPQQVEDISKIYQDKKGTVWVTTNNLGLFQYMPEKQSFLQYTNDSKNTESLSDNNVVDILEDRNGQLWISTNNGLNILNRDNGKFKRFYSIASDVHSLQSNQYECAFEDKEGVLWFGYNSGLGVDVHNPRRKLIEHYYNIPSDEQSLSMNRVWPILEDNQGYIWVGTVGGGLNRLDRKTGKFKRFRHDSQKPYSLPDDNVCHLLEDKTGKLWIRTNGGVSYFDKQTERFITYKHDPKNANSLSDDKGSGTMFQDHTGRIWVATSNGLNWFDGKNNYFHKYFHNPNNPKSISYNQICYIFEDSKYNLWVGTWNGKGLNRWDSTTNTFTRFMNDPKDPSTMVNRSVYFISEDKSGNIWTGGGEGMSCYNPKTNTFRNFTSRNGLPNDVAYSIVPDTKNRLWIATNHGLACFNLNDSTFRYFGPHDGLQSWEHNGFGYFQSKKTGEMYICGMGGFNIFHPDSIGSNSFKPPVYITSLKRFVSQGGGVNQVEVMNTHDMKNITLPHNAGLLTFEFAALSYSNASQNQYTYQLQGFSDQWNPLGTKREVTLAGLAAGKYILKVKGSNGDGLWNETPAELAITILPPWWQTWWAYLLYALAFIFALRNYIKYQSRKLEQENIQLEEKVHQRTNELEQKSTELEKSLTDLKATQTQLIQKEKLASLGELTAGIAHEIQNPLNFVNNFSELSVDLVKDVKEEIEKSPLTPEGGIIISDKAYFDELFDDLSQNQEKINHHGKRASSIVKGMLEHSRASTGVKELTDINKLADEYLRLSYHGLRAKDKDFNADYELIIDENLPKINVIPQDIGRVLLNLINNAFYAVNQRKQLSNDVNYTPSVSITTKQLEKAIEICVKDNGVGMPEAVSAKVFQPFFTTKPTGQGTGLGLSLAYDIVTKGHGGVLEVESTEGVGTTFVVKIPI